jgi:hypothetical protein
MLQRYCINWVVTILTCRTIINNNWQLGDLVCCSISIQIYVSLASIFVLCYFFGILVVTQLMRMDVPAYPLR